MAAHKARSEDAPDYFEIMIQQSSDAIISTDRDFTIKTWNRGAESMYGYSQEEEALVGKGEGAG